MGAGLTTKERIRQQARRVLEANWTEGTAQVGGQRIHYGYTRPAVPKYGQQWLWDSCFHAIVWSHFEPQRALQELDTLLAGMHPDGFLPHMILWPGTGSRVTQWAGRSWVNGMTSRITQPPVIAVALERVCEAVDDRSILGSSTSKESGDCLKDSLSLKDGHLFVKHIHLSIYNQ